MGSFAPPFQPCSTPATDPAGARPPSTRDLIAMLYMAARVSTETSHSSNEAADGYRNGKAAYRFADGFLRARRELAEEGQN